MALSTRAASLRAKFARMRCGVVAKSRLGVGLISMLSWSRTDRWRAAVGAGCCPPQGVRLILFALGGLDLIGKAPVLKTGAQKCACGFESHALRFAQQRLLLGERWCTKKRSGQTRSGPGSARPPGGSPYATRRPLPRPSKGC